MPDTFDPEYSWLKTWKENPRPPIIFYGASSYLIQVIRERGLEPPLEEQNYFAKDVQFILSLAKKVGQKRTIELAEITLLEHAPSPGPLRLTFNYHLALQQARRSTRRLEALQWLYEVFLQEIEKALGEGLEEAEVEEVKKINAELRDLLITTRSVIVYVSTNLDKLQGLPLIILDKKELKRAIKGKSPWCKEYLSEDRKWRDLSRSELEKCLERAVRGEMNYRAPGLPSPSAKEAPAYTSTFDGLGGKIETSEPIPPSDIIKVELVQP